MTVLKEIKKFAVVEEGDASYWRTYNNTEQAKQAQREEVLDKFLRNRRMECPDWRYKKYSDWSGWIETKTSVAERNAHVSGHNEGQREAIRDFIKFYPEIIAGLKKIDEAEVIKEDKND